MRRADGLDTAKDLVTSGHERVVIIDSLDAIINAGPGSPFGARLAALTEAGRLHMIPLLATCTPETLNLSTQTSGRLGTRASLILQVHCERSGPGGHEVVVSHRASGRQAGLLISEGSSLISLLSR
jgi:hypothetical protein